jgi:hypothetical protein
MAKSRTSTSSPARADWTVMVYLAGDNSLTDECTYSLTEMKKAGSGDRINIVAQFDPKDALLPTQRYRITRDDDSGALAKDIIDSSPFQKESSQAKLPDKGQSETDTGDPKTLFNFISFCVENYPADHYMVILSGHGSGIERDFLLKDESSARTLTIPELKGVFEEVHKLHKGKDGKGLVIDIVGMDVCLMSMAEISYELRNFVQILVGCESYSPAAGWPYRQVLNRLGELSNLGPRGKGRARRPDVQSKVATAIVEEFVNFYADYSLGGLSVDSSAMNVRGVGKLKNLIKELAGVLSAELTNAKTKDRFKDAIVLAHWEAQSYNGELFVDLFDFCDCLQQRYDSGGVREACNEVMDFIASSFVLKSCYSGPGFQYSNGVSIYFPWADVTPDYGNLGFARYSGWGRFLEVYTNETRRQPRQPRHRLSVGKQARSSARRDAQRLNAINVAAQSSLSQMSAAKASSKISSDTAGTRSFRQTIERGTTNPVRSMRNPPIVAFPDDCIRRREDVIKGLEKLFLK